MVPKPLGPSELNFDPCCPHFTYLASHWPT